MTVIMADSKNVSRRSDLDEYRRRFGTKLLLVLRDNGVADRFLSQRISAALQAFLRRRQFDQMLVLSEDIGFVLAALVKWSRWTGRLNIIVHAGQGGRRRRLFRITDSRKVANYITFCHRQREILVSEVGIDACRVHTLLNPVDTAFFNPELVDRPAGSAGCVFSCGLENRDYVTLLKAAALTDIPFIVQATGYFEESSRSLMRLDNVDMRKERVSFERLREMYHECLFTVVPLNSVDYAAGVNGILEAMSMGKAVIATTSPGMADYLNNDGIRTVPSGDADSLLLAIKELYESPDLCAEMGAKNRAWVSANCDVSDYVDRVAGLMKFAEAD